MLDNHNRAFICTHTIISVYIYIIYLYIYVIFCTYIYILCPINAADISKYSTPLKTNINPWSNGPCPRAVHLPPNPDGFLGSKVLRKLKRKSYLFIAIPWENHGNILRIQEYQIKQIASIMGIALESSWEYHQKLKIPEGPFLIQMEIGANGPLVQPADPKDQPIGR